MQIKILGTAAAEGWPGIFCGCDSCQRARELRAKNLRSRASVQIDDHYKIDLPPDTYYHNIRYNLDLSELKYLFFTHSHGDHFAPDEIEYTRSGFAHNLKNAPIQVYGNEKVISAIQRRSDRKKLPLDLNIAAPFSPIHADHLRFTPIIAHHADTETCFNYVIQSETSTVLYASDTGYYEQQTLEFLKQYCFDLLIVECTLGPTLLPSLKHMSMKGVLKLRDELRRSGAVSENTQVVITHFSHNIGLTHEELVKKATLKGLEVAYDGMVLEI